MFFSEEFFGVNVRQMYPATFCIDLQQNNSLRRRLGGMGLKSNPWWDGIEKQRPRSIYIELEVVGKKLPNGQLVNGGNAADGRYFDILHA